MTNHFGIKKPIVYIAHPIGGDVEKNIKRVLAIVRDLSLVNEVIPFAPYIVDVQSLDDSKFSERAIGFEHNMQMFLRGFIDEVWLYGGRISSGMQIEIDMAKNLSIPVKQMW